MSPDDTDPGWAVGLDGQLKDATEMGPWPHSPSDETRADESSLTIPDTSAGSSSVAKRTRAQTGNNGTVKLQNPKPPKGKKPQNKPKRKRQKTSEVPSETVENEDSEEDDEHPDDLLERLDAFSSADRANQIARSKSKQSADIRTIFRPETRWMNGKEIRGHVCTICSKNPHENKTWFTGGNSSLRGHISRDPKHCEIYLQLCEEQKIQPHGRAILPNLETNSPSQQTLETFLKPTVVYTPQRLLELVIKLVVTDDLAFRLLDKPAFREILLFMRPSTRETDIPHRTLLQKKIMEKAFSTIQDLRSSFKECKGRVSFTFDTWTSRAGDPYIAVTAHYITSPPDAPTEWRLKNVVIGFSYISGNHGGDNIARLITQAIKRFDLTQKIGWFTSDNATVNDAAMASLTKAGMAAEDIENFKPQDRRVRCAAHVINLAARAFIEGVAPTPAVDVCDKLSGTKRKRISIYDQGIDDEDGELIAEGETALEAAADDDDDDRQQAVEFDNGDLLGKVLALIKQIRLSPQARASFKESCVKRGLKPLELKGWVRTRWSSMYDLLTRFLLLQAAVDHFVAQADKSGKVPKLKKGRTYAMFAIKAEEWKRLELIAEVLQEPAAAQNTFSNETLPTVWRNLHTLEFMQTKWESFEASSKYSSVQLGLKRGLDILRKYYKLTDKTTVNLICHLLHPALKLVYIRNKWGAEWIKKARETIEDVLKLYELQIANSGTKGTAQKKTDEDVSMQIKSAGGYASAWMIDSIRNATLVEEGNSKSELDHYLNSPNEILVDDILVWWGRRTTEYPIMACMARDYLAIQGSSVASERCFSSGGLTGTDRRNRLNPSTFEGLQILKNAYRTGVVVETVESVEAVEEIGDSESDPFANFESGLDVDVDN